ncbi:MAG: DUF3429 domain-containing protein [Roseibium sp.]|nr:DUF3429 domain-containing protein [Roseibium sp.]
MNAADNAEPMLESENRIPGPALWLTAAGFLPFAALSLAAIIAPPDQHFQVRLALNMYGAIILSFLGGIHWGLEMGRQGTVRGAPSLSRLGASVVPALVAWGCLAMPYDYGSAALAGAFGLMLAFDLYCARSGLVPIWYPRLRVPVSLGVMVAILVPGAM